MLAFNLLGKISYIIRQPKWEGIKDADGAARFLIRTGGGKDEVAADAAALGIELPPQLTKPETFEVLPENRDAVTAAGLKWKKVFGKLQAIEYATLGADDR